MTFAASFDNSYARLPAAFYTRLDPVPVTAPKLLAYNEKLGGILGLPHASDAERAVIFSGSAVPDGAAPLAQLYAGHQFGSFNPQLGDGRAILLGETVGTDGHRRDIQLKGSGPTPYSRMGDGRAWLGPVLREYVVSEAMHALGIPTTRALAATLTGEDVIRETVLPGAVFTRVAASHLRVGTFQVFAHRGQKAELKQLTDYAIDRHYPDAQTPMDLLGAVCAAQADLIAAWMSVGFIHGVMNTDNCTISGETIDYGPCAFLDDYHADTVFSSIDQTGRYAYSNQPRIVVWNMAQFATSLIQQYDDPAAAIEEATEIVHAMPGQIENGWRRKFGAKIGLATPQPDDSRLIEDLLGLMQADGADFTNTFDALARGAARDQFVDRDAFDAWEETWRARLQTERAPEEVMQTASPRIVPRNHRIEEMITAAVAGDYAPFDRLIAAFSDPFGTADLDLMRPPTKAQRVAATFCGT
ncbi:YdiU family protein [Roseobacter sp. YSTF-M11]|uniref:Protein nucleotidyltransferase YdiU n=1 Tax=Roseobacter insulae TaxID=2859783 RepID=A0A9X1K0D8_9RHOB|nr:YdiU family protein [Roseobacter insulae]MBW4708074.1 YdiU family protein [Roseobacter insulae]